MEPYKVIFTVTFLAFDALAMPQFCVTYIIQCKQCNIKVTFNDKETYFRIENLLSLQTVSTQFNILVDNLQFQCTDNFEVFVIVLTLRLTHFSWDVW